MTKTGAGKRDEKESGSLFSRNDCGFVCTDATRCGYDLG
jgi:hypothetical protein